MRKCATIIVGEAGSVEGDGVGRTSAGDSGHGSE